MPEQPEPPAGARVDTSLAIGADPSVELQRQAPGGDGAVTAITEPGQERQPEGRQASLWHDAWIELRGNPLFVVAALLIVVLTVMAIRPSLFTNVSPRQCDLLNSLKRPSAGHPFGYDLQGCDYYSNVVYGAKASISVGLLSTGAAFILAIVAGAIAGWYGGAIDAVIARFTDIFFAIPTILGGIVLLSVIEGRGIFQVSVVLIALGWMTMLRLVRSSVISTKENDYVVAAKALGANDLRIIRRHVLPNAIAPVIVYATIYVGIIIAAEASLSFLGVGLQLPNISWGLQLNAAQNRLLQAPHLLLFPGVLLSIAIFAFILMGDALRDALDPKLR